MKSKIILVLSFVFIISCAPHIDYYKPLLYFEKTNFENTKLIHDHYYITKLNDSLEVKTNLIVGSLPKTKEIYFHIGFNNSTKIDSVKIFSKRIKLNLNHKSKVDDNFTDEYFESFEMNDHRWYSKFKKKSDTLNVSVYYNNKVLNVSYYYNHKNSLETYPF